MEELIDKAKSGDEEAFTKIIISMEQSLYKIARIRLNCEDDINEVVQETIVEIFKNLRKLKKIEFFRTWAIKILINKCNKLYKDKKKNLVNIERNDGNLLVDYSVKNYEEEIESKIDFEILIKTLNYNERIIITLYYLEELNSKEISKILRKPESTIRNQLSRARQKLKKVL